jgi:hypothetical protein
MTVALTFAATLPALCDEGPEQLVWLRSGGFVRGTLIELAPGSHVTVRLPSGEVRKIPQAEIDRTLTQGASPAVGGGSAAPSAMASTAVPLAPRGRDAVPSVPAVPPGAPSAVGVRIVSTWENTVLQARPHLERVPWESICTAPCDASVVVADRELRVAGQGMTPSQAFLLAPGQGTTRIQVKPGSESTRNLGRIALFAGIPVALVGGVGLGLAAGTDVEPHDAFAVGGLVTALVGGALVLAALPLLASGTTTVVNQKGERIGRLPTDSSGF